MSQVPIGDRRAIKNPNLKFKLDLEEQRNNQVKEEEVKEKIMLKNESLVVQQKLINSQEQDMSSD